MNEIITTTIKVQGMDCADEVTAVKSALKIPGIQNVETDIMKETVTIYHDSKVKQERLELLIKESGLTVAIESNSNYFESHSKRKMIVGLSGLLLAFGLFFEIAQKQYTLMTYFLFLLSIFLSGSLIFPKAIRSIQKFKLDMNVLMSIAVIGAIAIKEYSEAASVVFLFSLAELLEAMSVSRARRAIQEVLKIAPKEAITVTPDGSLLTKEVKELKIGDVLLVRPHDNIATDGIIIEGETLINQSSLTGESIAVEKGVGDNVFGGTINESSVIKIKVEKNFEDSKLAKVINLIESSQADKAPAQRFVDRFSEIYTPSILILAIATAIIPPLLGFGIWEDWIYKALVLLVIGCPCALVIATPVSIVSGLTFLAKKGILIKGGVHLETLGRLKVLAVDKTGTITEGKPSISGIKLFSDKSKEECTRLAASLESFSNHPLAISVVNLAISESIEFPSPLNFRVLTGQGAVGVVDDHYYFVGNHKLAHGLKVCTPEIESYLQEVESQSMSLVILGHMPHQNCEGEILAVFTLTDKIREGIQTTIKELHKAGVSNVVMLSGDNQKTVTAISSQAGIDMALGNLLPEDKVNEISNLVKKYQYVGMVGDGVNDAPALATASLGIAMGIVGSDTAIETADVALMKDDLSMIPLSIRQGRRVLNVIRFNIVFAILIKVVFLILAFVGIANLWTAVAADMGASLLVTFNALRLLRSE